MFISPCSVFCSGVVGISYCMELLYDPQQDNRKYLDTGMQ
jgi:hypothetical protein